MMILLTIIHVLVCVFLVIVVLLQSGKAADLAGAFGGMGSDSLRPAWRSDGAFESHHDRRGFVHGHFPFVGNFGNEECGYRIVGA